MQEKEKLDDEEEETKNRQKTTTSAPVKAADRPVCILYKSLVARR